MVKFKTAITSYRDRATVFRLLFQLLYTIAFAEAYMTRRCISLNSPFLYSNYISWTLLYYLSAGVDKMHRSRSHTWKDIISWRLYLRQIIIAPYACSRQCKVAFVAIIMLRLQVIGNYLSRPVKFSCYLSLTVQISRMGFSVNLVWYVVLRWMSLLSHMTISSVTRVASMYHFQEYSLLNSLSVLATVPNLINNVRKRCILSFRKALSSLTASRLYSWTVLDDVFHLSS